jgi:hypothetical protein
VRPGQRNYENLSTEGGWPAARCVSGAEVGSCESCIGAGAALPSVADGYDI